MHSCHTHLGRLDSPSHRPALYSRQQAMLSDLPPLAARLWPGGQPQAGNAPRRKGWWQGGKGGGGGQMRRVRGSRVHRRGLCVVRRSVGAEASTASVHGAWCARASCGVQHAASCGPKRGGRRYLIVPDACDRRGRRHDQLTFVVPVCARGAWRVCVRAFLWACAHVCTCVRVIVCMRARVCVSVEARFFKRGSGNREGAAVAAGGRASDGRREAGSGAGAERGKRRSGGPPNAWSGLRASLCAVQVAVQQHDLPVRQPDHHQVHVLA